MFASFVDDVGAAPVLEAVASALGARRCDIAPAISPAMEINASRVAPVLVTGGTLAYWAVLRDVLPAPVAVMGYSVGELAAHAIAESIPATVAVHLAWLRSGLMDDCVGPAQGMIALPACPEPILRQILSGFALEIAIRNGPDHVVLGGLTRDIEAASRCLDGLHVPYRRLSVAVASHTSLMRDAVGAFHGALHKAGLQRPQLPVLSGWSGNLIRTPQEAMDSLAGQLASTLNWRRCMDVARERGVSCFLEIGPGGALAKIAADLFPDLPARSVEDFKSVAGIAAWVDRNANG